MLAFAAMSLLLSRPNDEAYLRKLEADTWRCISSMVAPSGLPYDDSTKGESTSVTNIGLYLTDVVVAQRLGLISSAERDQRLSRTLTSLSKLKTWFGFQQCWNSVVTLEPASHDTWISTLDSGNLAAGLLAVAGASPAHSKAYLKLVHAMDWSKFYDGAILGGYNTQTGQVNPKWHLDMLGTDARIAQLLAVGTKAAPASVWEKLNRETETREGHTYLKPGWQGGGLFMQFLSGIWVPEQGTVLGESAAEFARAQIAAAKSMGSPVWGWSACSSPDGGYLGWGAIQDEVVTAHASALAIDIDPSSVVNNLRELESMGSRSTDQGFYDSVNWKTRRVSKKFLMLDQSMLFLSLGNHLEGHCIQKWVTMNALVTLSCHLVPDYATKHP